MDIRRLEAFAKVYEHKSFSKAASELYLSQPTISTHVAGLESDLGVVLFDRMGRQVLPTQAADVLYGYAGKVFKNLEAARAEVMALQDHIAGDLSLGGSTIPAHFLLPELLAAFRKRYPEVNVELKVGDSREIVDLVSSGALICGMVGAAYERPDLQFIPLYEDSMAVIAAPGFVEQAGEMGVRELAGYPWVMRENGSGTRRALETALSSAGLDLRELRISVGVDSTQGVIQFVCAGHGVSAVSRLAAAEHLQSGRLVEIPVSGLVMERWFHLVYHNRRHLFPAVQRFIDFVQDKAAKAD